MLVFPIPLFKKCHLIYPMNFELGNNPPLDHLSNWWQKQNQWQNWEFHTWVTLNCQVWHQSHALWQHNLGKPLKQAVIKVDLTHTNACIKTLNHGFMGKWIPIVVFSQHNKCFMIAMCPILFQLLLINYHYP